MEFLVHLRQPAIRRAPVRVAPPIILRAGHVLLGQELRELMVEFVVLPPPVRQRPAHNAQTLTPQPAPQAMTNFGNVPLDSLFPRDKNAVSGMGFLATTINHSLLVPKFTIKHMVLVAQAGRATRQLEQYQQVILPD